MSSDVPDAATTLVTVVVDILAPTVEEYRRELGRALDLDPVEHLCVDLLRRLGALSSATVAERTGVTRSAVSKALRRLERDGHLRREPSADHRQGVVVVLREHAERDAVLQRQRARLERELRDVVDRFGDSPDLQAVVIGVCSRISHELHRCTRDLAHRRWGEARVDEIRRERQAWLNR